MDVDLLGKSGLVHSKSGTPLIDSLTSLFRYSERTEKKIERKEI